MKFNYCSKVYNSSIITNKYYIQNLKTLSLWNKFLENQFFFPTKAILLINQRYYKDVNWATGKVPKSE